LLRSILTEKTFHIVANCEADLTTAETETIRAGVDLAFVADADDGARAILLVGEKLPDAMNTFLLVRRGRIQWPGRTGDT